MRDIHNNYEHDQKKMQDAIESYRQRTYLSIISNEHDFFCFGNSYVKVGWLKYGQDAMILSITHNAVNPEMIKEAEYFKPCIEAQDRKTMCKIVSAILCDTFWRMTLKYWLMWRWFYYVRRHESDELENIIAISFLQRNHAEQFFNTESQNLENLKRYKWLYETKSWLFGLVRCQNYEYLWCQTKAQLDLMASEKYLTKYKNEY